MSNSMRFECFAQPDGLWTVWDNIADRPAGPAADAIAASEAEATTLCENLNMLSASGPTEPIE